MFREHASDCHCDGASPERTVLVGQAFQPAGSENAGNGRLDSLPHDLLTWLRVKLTQLEAK